MTVTIGSSDCNKDLTVTKILAYACVVLVALATALGLSLRHQIAANGALSARAEGAEKALSAAQDQRKKDGALLTRRQAEVVSERRKSATLSKALKQAQEASPEWAGTPTPPAVQKALEEAVEGLE